MKLTLDFAGNDFLKEQNLFINISLKEGTLKEYAFVKLSSDEEERKKFEIEVS